MRKDECCNGQKEEKLALRGVPYVTWVFLAGFSLAHVLPCVDSRWYATVHVVICAQMVILPTDEKCLKRAKHTLFLLEKVEDIIVRKLNRNRM